MHARRDHDLSLPEKPCHFALGHLRQQLCGVFYVEPLDPANRVRIVGERQADKLRVGLSGEDQGDRLEENVVAHVGSDTPWIDDDRFVHGGRRCIEYVCSDPAASGRDQGGFA